MPAMRNQSASVLLPPAQDQRVMIVGGGGEEMHDHDMKKPQVATRSVAIADLGAATPKYKAAAKIKHARMHLNTVLLPDRTVLAAGGAAVEEHKVNAALEAEIFDPAAGTWRTAAKARVARLYHSVALLTPDGKVITAGSNPHRGVEELRIEVFSPPYLFNGARPALSLADDHAVYGATLAATTGADLREVNLVRPSATTHASNSEQRCSTSRSRSPVRRRSSSRCPTTPTSPRRGGTWCSPSAPAAYPRWHSGCTCSHNERADDGGEPQPAQGAGLQGPAPSRALRPLPPAVPHDRPELGVRGGADRHHAVRVDVLPHARGLRREGAATPGR